MKPPEESFILNDSGYEKPFQLRVVTPPGAQTLQDHRDQVITAAELHAEEVKASCTGYIALGGCAARVDVSIINEHGRMPQANKVETYRIVCQKPCDSNLPKVDPPEQPVQIV